MNGSTGTNTRAARTATPPVADDARWEPRPDWEGMLRERLARLGTVEHLSWPRLKCVTERGVPAWRCKFDWWCDGRRREVCSAAAPSPEQALDDAIARAALPPPVPKPETSHAEWIAQALKLHGNPRLCQPRFVPADDGRLWHCIFHPLPGGATVCSIAGTSKLEALRDAVQKLQRLGLCRAAADNYGSPLPVSVAPRRPHYIEAQQRQGATAPLTPEIVRQAVSAWRTEHGYLLRLRTRSKQQDDRLHQLSLFCAASDQLRKHEIDRAAMPKLVHFIAAEIAQHLERQTPQWQALAAAEALRLLTGVAFSEAGIAAVVRPQFEALCASWGMTAEVVVQSLVERRMLRRNGSSLTLSPIGATCMERALTVKAGPMSVKARVSPTEVAQLLQLKLDIVGRA